MKRLPLPAGYDPTNLVDMVYWCRVLREIYRASGNRDGVEKTYIMASRVRNAREREERLKQSVEGFHVTKQSDESEYPYR